jgi:iron complex transport system substrate-binding protein
MAVVIALLFAFCSAGAQASVDVVDDVGATVRLEQPAQRIVTVVPHAAELVFAAGAGNRVVGVIKGTDFPPATRALPVIGDVNALDLERIVALAPDLVVTWPWSTPAQVAWLRAHGVAVYEANPRTIDGIARDIERIGTLAGTAPVAERAAGTFRARLARLAAERSAGPALRVFYQVSGVPIFTLGGRHLVTQAITLCGGENVFAELAIPAPQVSVEAVLAARPDVIIGGTDDARRPAWLDTWQRWPALVAVRRHLLFVVDANLLHRPGPRFVDGVAQLCNMLAKAREALEMPGDHPKLGAMRPGGQ